MKGHHLADWTRGAWRIYHARCSAERYSRIDRHWADLSIEALKCCEDATALEAVLEVATHLHLKPLRGQRGGTKWEFVNMAVKNRLWQLARDADWASMGEGNNSSRRAA